MDMLYSISAGCQVPSERTSPTFLSWFLCDQTSILTAVLDGFGELGGLDIVRSFKDGNHTNHSDLSKESENQLSASFPPEMIYFIAEISFFAFPIILS